MHDSPFKICDVFPIALNANIDIVRKKSRKHGPEYTEIRLPHNQFRQEARATRLQADSICWTSRAHGSACVGTQCSTTPVRGRNPTTQRPSREISISGRGKSSRSGLCRLEPAWTTVRSQFVYFSFLLCTLGLHAQTTRSSDAHFSHAYTIATFLSSICELVLVPLCLCMNMPWLHWYLNFELPYTYMQTCRHAKAYELGRTN
jgi:hypothetical protein